MSVAVGPAPDAAEVAAARQRAASTLTRERVALALFALSGAAFMPGALNRFVFPKLLCVALAVALAATVPARGRLPRAAVVLLAGGSLLLLVDALAGRTPLLQLIGLPPRYEGMLSTPLYLGAGVAGARLLGTQRARGSTRWLLRALSVAALAIALEAVLEVAGLRPLSSNVARPGSLLGNASDEGAWALLALGPLLAVAIRVGGKLFSAGAVAAGAIVVCSGSRGALLGAAVVVLVLAATASSRQARVVIAAAAAVLLLGALALPQTRARLTGSGGDASQTVTGRELLWQETLKLVVQMPALGVGPSGYLDTIPQYHTRSYEHQIGPANPPDSPHDWLLQAAADGGIPLLVAALLLAALTARSGWRALREQPSGGEAAFIAGMLGGLSGYGTALLFHFTSPGTTPLAAVFGGALLAGSPTSRSGDRLAALWRRARGCARVTAGGAAVALGVVAALGCASQVELRAGIDDAAGGHLQRSQIAFQTAADLAPWDVEVSVTAAHAYATLASLGIEQATRPGLRWSARELRRWPDNIQALEDAATLASAAHRPARAAALVRRALVLEPQNPVLRAALRRLMRARI